MILPTCFSMELLFIIIIIILLYYIIIIIYLLDFFSWQWTHWGQKETFCCCFKKKRDLFIVFRLLWAMRYNQWTFSHKSMREEL